MLALLPSPSPPQIMPLIINRMRACSSWKAGTGTSLLNGAAQLGLKLFNRNMKAPSVRRTRPSEVTACRPSPASTPLPTAWVLLPLLSCPSSAPAPCGGAPRCTPSSSHTSKFQPHSRGPFTSTRAGWFIQLPHAPFSLWLSFSFSAKPDFLFAAQFAPWLGCPISVDAAKPLVPAHGVPPAALLLPWGEAELSRAHLGSTPRWSSWVRKCCFRDRAEGESLGLHTGCWQHMGTGERGAAGGSYLALSAASSRGDKAAKWQGEFCPSSCQAWLRQAVPFLQREVCS